MFVFFRSVVIYIYVITSLLSFVLLGIFHIMFSQFSLAFSLGFFHFHYLSWVYGFYLIIQILQAGIFHNRPYKYLLFFCKKEVHLRVINLYTTTYISDITSGLQDFKRLQKISIDFKELQRLQQTLKTSMDFKHFKRLQKTL